MRSADALLSHHVTLSTNLSGWCERREINRLSHDSILGYAVFTQQTLTEITQVKAKFIFKGTSTNCLNRS